ncbi:barstar family protein [Actinomadura madurae]|uniref:barstar family protein n=1 Tax=Actinomadura madurae TaxID=1993 RepID=UPI0020D25E0F|nr:barstar family protein [Actinomadura madurae]MCQ0017662.1 barstar family protein [Actinomadura madurae]
MDANQALTELLAGRLEPGVYQWRTPPVPGAVGDTSWIGRAEEAGWRGFYLDGRRARTEESFLRLCGGVFELPERAGTGWDDLGEYLKDLSWTPPSTATWCCTSRGPNWPTRTRRRCAPSWTSSPER